MNPLGTPKNYANAGEMSSINDINLRFGNRVEKHNFYFNSQGEELPSFVSQLLELHNRTIAGVVGPNEAAGFLSKNQNFLSKHLMHQAAEAGRVDLQKTTSDFLANTYAEHGYQVELLRTKLVVNSTGIPIEQKVMQQHNMYTKGLAKNPLGVHGEYQADNSNINYYHLERSSTSHNTLHLNELAAGEMVMDMDGDEATVQVFYKNDRHGNRIDEFLVPYKEPLTQNAPRFQNIKYSGVGFDGSKLYGQFSGLNFTNLGTQLENAESIKNAYSGESSVNKYSLLGDFRREYLGGLTDNYGFSGGRNLEALSSKIASKQLADNNVGILTNTFDVRAMYNTVTGLNALRQHQPEMYKSLLIEQQIAAEEYLKVLRSDRNTTPTITNTRAFGQISANGEKFQGNYEEFLEELLKNRDNPDSNATLRQQVQRYAMQTKFLDDPERVAAIEGAMKAQRTANVNVKSVTDIAILNDFKVMLNNPELYHKVNSITNLDHNANIKAIQNMFGKDLNHTSLQAIFGDVSESDFKLRATSIAENLTAKRIGNQINLNNSTNLIDTLRNTHIDDNGNTLLGMKRVGSKTALFADHLADEVDYQDPLAIYFRDQHGKIKAPTRNLGEKSFSDIGLVGNVATVQNGELGFANRYNYIGAELERRMGESFKGQRGFGQTTEHMSYQSLTNALSNGNRRLLNELADIQGFSGVDQAGMEGWRTNLLGRLQESGENSGLHKQLALKYDLHHRDWMYSKLRSHMNDIVSSLGGITNATAEFNKGQLNVNGFNAADIYKASAGYAIDSGFDYSSAEQLSGLAKQGISKAGGFIRKNTGQDNHRYLHMTYGTAPGDIANLGVDPHYYMPFDLARRSADIQRQLPGGTMLGKVNVLMGDTEVSNQLFNMYNVNAGMGAKRHDEGLILMSKSFQTRMIDQVKKTMRVGPNLSDLELDSASTRYADYMMQETQGTLGRNLLHNERQDIQEKLITEYRKFYSKQGDYHVLNEEGFDSHLSKITKLGSLFGDKATVMTVDDLQSGGQSFDLFMHVNQARSRSNVIVRMQQAAETALAQGRVTANDFGENVVRDGKVHVNHLFEGDLNPNDFTSRIERDFLTGLKKAGQSAEITVDGVTQKTGNMLAFAANDFFTVGNHPDVFKQYEAPNFNLRGMSRLKLSGRIANALDHELGGAVINAGAQFLLHEVGEVASSTLKNTRIGQKLVNRVTHHEVMQSTEKLLSLAATHGQALHDLVGESIEW